MADHRRYLRIAGVLVIAGGTGHLMQSGGEILRGLGLGDGSVQAAAAPYLQPTLPVAPRPGPERALAQPPAAAAPPPPHGQAAALAMPQDAPQVAWGTRTDGGSALVPVAAEVTPGTTGCAPSLSARAEPAAMVALSFAAPCHPNSRVVIDHHAIRFAARTDAQGRLDVRVPALAPSAAFLASVEGLRPAEASLEVPLLADFDRVAVTWAGHAGLELHAFEFGATYGEAGHVWHANPRQPGHAEGGSGGFSLRLGDPAQPAPLMAEIYTFPSARSASDGTVRLTLEAEVTAATCGGEVLGRTLHVQAGAEARPVEVALAMPGCEGTGDYLVLHGLFRPLRTAR